MNTNKDKQSSLNSGYRHEYTFTHTSFIQHKLRISAQKFVQETLIVLLISYYFSYQVQQASLRMYRVVSSIQFKTSNGIFFPSGKQEYFFTICYQSIFSPIVHVNQVSHFENLENQEVTAARAHPRCANAHNCLGLTLEVMFFKIV